MVFADSFPVRTWANESSSRIEFLLDQNHRQIRPLCLNQRGDRIQNGATIATLYDPPASTTDWTKLQMAIWRYGNFFDSAVFF